MPPFCRLYNTIVFAVLVALLVSCNRLKLPSTSVVNPPTTSEPIVVIHDAGLAPPPLVQSEEPLASLSPTVPDVFVVFREQSVSELATYLKTTPEQLLARNPSVTDPVALGALIVIPPLYEVTQAATLSSVAAATGFQETQLLAANPALHESTVLTAGTVLAMPQLLIVYEEKPLRALAGAVNTSADLMLSANPDLSEDETVLAGTVLVVPADVSPEPTPIK